MYNVTIKTLSVFILTLTSIGCTSSSDSKDAANIYTEAEAAQKKGDNTFAIELLDSLDSCFPSEVDLRRRAMHIRALAMEGLYASQLSTADSIIAVTQIRVDSLGRMMNRINNSIEPYYIVKGSSLAPTGIQARISPDGVFYIVSSLDGHRIGHTALSLSSERGNVMSSNVGYDGERNTRSGSVECVHFVGAECDTLGRFALDNRDIPIRLSFHGSSTYSRPLTQSEANAVATAYDYSSSTIALKVATLEHERLEKQLAVARNQSARTFIDKDKQINK